MSEWPNFYAAAFALGNATTEAAAISFGFDARTLRLENGEPVDIYVRLTSTSLGLATTADVIIPSSGSLNLTCDGLAGLSAYTTSTAASNKLLRVVALR